MPPFTLCWRDVAAPVVAVAPVGWAPWAVLMRWLTAGEQRRLGQLPAGRRRAEYLAAHALLHRLAAGAGPREFRRAADGRPLILLHGRRRAAALGHAGGLVAAGLAPGERAVGLDLEFPRPARTFEAAERRYGWPPRDPARRLLRWCLWEACGKARGRGVFRRDDPVFDALWCEATGTVVGTEGWQAHALTLPGGGRLAVVYAGGPHGRPNVQPGLPGAGSR